MKLLVTGGRNFNDYTLFCAHMEQFLRCKFIMPEMIIHGDCSGADTLAKQWAVEHAVHYAAVPALWLCFEGAAGPRRNSAMLLLAPDACLALPGHNGTLDMIKKCESAGIPVFKFW